ncbi:GumC family protein [Thalassolituus oleivorans]|uniref:GumC family protein n=1 Tax=Thalassolituus oleivorans TaxID=187493 RepID=UPI0023F09363|nr:polysaccharide biosynthesis tyrosine autokinase [Thalassolituus oleivorans]
MNNAAAVEVIDLTHYWHVIRRQARKIMALSVIATIIAVLVALVMTPIYRATATLLIESEEAKILSIEEVYGLSGQSSEYFLTQFEILKSRELAKRVVLQLGLVDNPEFNPYHEANGKSFSLREFILGAEEPPTADEVLAKTIENFWEAISIEPVRKTQLVNISVESQSPELAYAAANAVAIGYIESQMEARVGLTQQAAVWLSDRLGGLKEKLSESERKLQTYREQNDLVDIEGVNTLVAKETDQITERLIDARSRRLELEGTYRQLQSLEEKTYESLSSLPSILNNPLVVKLRENESNAELKVSELSKRYGPLHPRMIAAQSDLDAVRDSVFTQMKRIANGIENDFLVAKSKENSLQSALNSTKARIRDMNRTEFELNDYVREVRANRGLYETFFNRISETSVTGDLQTANARVIDPAVLPKEPIKPNKKLIVALALVVSAMFGIALAFLLDALDATVKNAEDVDRKLGVSLLGIVPLIARIASAKRKKNIDLNKLDATLVRAFVEGADHGFQESIRTLRTSLTLASLENKAQVMLFTSSVPGEGKTTTSTNLAEAFGQMEKVVLIDADMRRPTVARKLNMPSNSRGLSNAVAYPETLDDCIHHVADLGIDVIPAGPIPPNPLELLASKNFTALLETLKGRYDRIIIDSAPIHAVSDAAYLSTLVDGVVYVVKADGTKDKMIKSGIARLHDSNARILGVLLNQMDIEKEARYGGHYSGYYDGYGYTTTEQS